MNGALILVDIQNDFLPPKGTLAVPEARDIIPVALKAAGCFDYVIATQDWHPADHGSFASQHKGKNPGEFIMLDGLEQILWPDHCVQDTFGSQFAEELKVIKFDKIITKGENRLCDSYSGFYDNSRRHKTELDDYLRILGVKDVTIMGLATDYCVKFTAIDAIESGYRVNLISEGVRGVELQDGDCEKALSDMASAGVKIISIHEI